MRGAEKLVLMVAVAVPLIVASVGWPMFVNWISGPPPAATPSAAAQPTPAAAAPRPASQPTLAAAAPTPAKQPTATPAPTARAPQAVQPTAVAAAAISPSDPSQAVATFYALVANHQFDTAAQLWSPRMQATFPPRQNIDQRFSQTQSINVQRADVVSQDQGQATVAVDLVESVPQAGPRHYVGTWHLVHGASGWMLDQPDLQPAP